MLITITEAAALKIRADVAELGEPGDCLRISVVGRGNSGLQFGFDFEPARPDDLVHDLSGCTVVIDPVSAEHMRGYTVDVNEIGFRLIPPGGQ